jgi:hypothetical protein
MGHWSPARLHQVPSTQQWARVTDPHAIAAFLNRPGGGILDGWTIYTTDPDVDLLPKHAASGDMQASIVYPQLLPGDVQRVVLACVRYSTRCGWHPAQAGTRSLSQAAPLPRPVTQPPSTVNVRCAFDEPIAVAGRSTLRNQPKNRNRSPGPTPSLGILLLRRMQCLGTGTLKNQDPTRTNDATRVRATGDGRIQR